MAVSGAPDLVTACDQVPIRFEVVSARSRSVREEFDGLDVGSDEADEVPVDVSLCSVSDLTGFLTSPPPESVGIQPLEDVHLEPSHGLSNWRGQVGGCVVAADEQGLLQCPCLQDPPIVGSRGESENQDPAVPPQLPLHEVLHAFPLVAGTRDEWGAERHSNELIGGRILWLNRPRFRAGSF